LLKRAILVFLAAICLPLCALPQEPAGTTATGQAASFEERLGEDDGAALAILFGANLRGNLDPCD
jgi:hypothetical protein